jgi:hypothetical protein
MKKRGTWLVVVASLGAVLACGSGNNGSNSSGSNNGSGSGSGGFPYTGPSCASGVVDQGCWGCLENSCNGGCLTSACNDFFTCFCNCAQGDNSCYEGCSTSISATCDQCVQGIGSCAQSSCSSTCGGSSGLQPPMNGSSSGGSSSSSSSGGPPMAVGCSGSGQVCAGGVSEQFCQTEIGNMCTSAYYQVGAQTFNCASCSDTAGCQQEAEAACGPTLIDAGPPDDTGPADTGPLPDAPFLDSGNVTCTPHACGTMGQSMTFCESFDPNDACTGAWYEVAGQLFDCNSCVDCTTAAQQASAACP